MNDDIERRIYNTPPTDREMSAADGVFLGVIISSAVWAVIAGVIWWWVA
jgi:hypothetical protein